jgi:hypothetical protein
MESKMWEQAFKIFLRSNSPFKLLSQVNLLTTTNIFKVMVKFSLCLTN